MFLYPASFYLAVRERVPEPEPLLQQQESRLKSAKCGTLSALRQTILDQKL